MIGFDSLFEDHHASIQALTKILARKNIISAEEFSTEFLRAKADLDQESARALDPTKDDEFGHEAMRQRVGRVIRRLSKALAAPGCEVQVLPTEDGWQVNLFSEVKSTESTTFRGDNAELRARAYGSLIENLSAEVKGD